MRNPTKSLDLHWKTIGFTMESMRFGLGDMFKPLEFFYGIHGVQDGLDVIWTSGAGVD